MDGVQALAEADEERPALLDVAVDLGVAALLQAGADRVDEPRVHERVDVVVGRARVGIERAVAQQRAHPPRRREADEKRAALEDLGVGADGQRPAVDARRVRTHHDAIRRLDRGDARHRDTSCSRHQLGLFVAQVSSRRRAPPPRSGPAGWRAGSGMLRCLQLSDLGACFVALGKGLVPLAHRGAQRGA